MAELTTIEVVAKRIEDFIVTQVLRGAKSSKLMGSSLSDVVGKAKESKVPVLTVGGARNYSGAYADSDSDVSYETLTNAAVRQVCYTVPRTESLQAGLKMLAKIAEKQGMKEMVKEIDAVRFANLAAGATTVTTTVPDEDNVEALLKAAQTSLFELGYDRDEITIYMNSATSDLLDGKIVWDTPNMTGEIKQIVGIYNESEIIVVPQSRFYSQITLLDTTAGGFEKTAVTGKDLRFIAVAIGDEIIPTKGTDHSLIIPAEKNTLGYNDEFKSVFGYDLHVLGAEGANRIYVNQEA